MERRSIQVVHARRVFLLPPLFRPRQRRVPHPSSTTAFGPSRLPAMGRSAGARRLALGSHDPDTISALVNLACARSYLGHHDEAEAMGRDALERSRRLFGNRNRGYELVPALCVIKLNILYYIPTRMSIPKPCNGITLYLYLFSGEQTASEHLP